MKLTLLVFLSRGINGTTVPFNYLIIDSLSRLIADPDPDWKTLRENAFKVPAVVLSFPKGMPIEVAVEG